MLHESTTYFERCHAAELRDDVPVEWRYECWERWLRWYTRDQEQARVLYARERLVFLAQGESLDPLPSSNTVTVVPAMEGDVPPPIAEGTAAASAGAGTTATPPPVSEADARRRERYRPSPRATGNSVCEPLCRPRYNGCVDLCEADARPCVSACEANYRSCMQACF